MDSHGSCEGEERREISLHEIAHQVRDAYFADPPWPPAQGVSDLAEIAARLCSARPEWRVASTELAAWLAERPEAASSEHVDDVFVAWCAMRGVRQAVDEIARRITTLPLSHRRARVSDETLAEARQRLLERMLVGSGNGPARIGTYAGDGPLDGWLRVSLAREAVALERSSSRETPWDELLAPVHAETPEEQYLKSLYEGSYKRAVAVAAAGLTTRERSILRQHLLLGMTVDRLGELYGVHRVTASRWVVSAKNALLEGTRRQLRLELGLSTADLAGLARLIESRVDLSLARVLAARPDPDS